MTMKKKLLILAGANVHVKLVKTAKEMGIYTIVTDYLTPEDSPAKQVADEFWMLDIKDVDGIVEQCQKEHVDGVIGPWIDPCQRPYQEICNRLGMPCYGTKDQFYKMTDKSAFKKMCIENGVDVIPEYTFQEVLDGKVKYPLLVKPVDSRGSRGQTVCYNYQEVIEAVQVAEQESSDGRYIIEKFLKDKIEFEVTYFFLGGKPYLIRTCDGYKGSVDEHLEKISICEISPSQYTDEYLKDSALKVERMLTNIGLTDGPAFMQAFYDDGVFRFYDPGLRFPGVNYDLIYEKLYNYSTIRLMVIYALTGDISREHILDDMVRLKGNRVAVLFPTVREGTIASISGVKDILKLPSVFSICIKHSNEDYVPWSFDVNQRLAEIDIASETTVGLKNEILKVQSMLKVVDKFADSMMYCPFDVSRIIWAHHQLV